MKTSLKARLGLESRGSNNSNQRRPNSEREEMSPTQHPRVPKNLTTSVMCRVGHTVSKNSLLDNAPKQVVGCIIQKRIRELFVFPILLHSKRLKFFSPIIAHYVESAVNALVVYLGFFRIHNILHKPNDTVKLFRLSST